MAIMSQISNLNISAVVLPAADYILLCNLSVWVDGRLQKKVLTRETSRRLPHLFLIHSHSFGRFIMRYHLLAIQAVGGIKVSSAQNYDQLTAGDVMRLGIIFQFSNTIVLALLIVGARLRVRQKKGVLDRIVYP